MFTLSVFSACVHVHVCVCKLRESCPSHIFITFRSNAVLQIWFFIVAFLCIFVVC